MRNIRSIAVSAVFSIGFGVTSLAWAAQGPAKQPADDLAGWEKANIPKVGQGGGYLAVNHANGDLYYNICSGGLWKSADAGKTFTRIGEGKMFPSDWLCGEVLVTPDGNKMFACGFTESDVIKQNTSGFSLDAGKTWQAVENIGGGYRYAAIEPGAGKTLLAAASHKGWKLEYSGDLGKTWTQLDKKYDGVRGMGVFDPQDLILAQWFGIERSTDAGKTWTKVSDIGWCNGPMVTLKEAAYLVSPRGLLASKDKGAMWVVLGTAPASPIEKGFPFCLGKDEKNFVVVTKEGLTETTDAGQTWKFIAALPGHNEGENTSIDYDAIHHVFYLANHFHAARGVLVFHAAGEPKADAK